MPEANPLHAFKTQTKLQLEEKLDDLVAEMYRVKLSHMDVLHMLELKVFSIKEAMSQEDLG